MWLGSPPNAGIVRLSETEAVEVYRGAAEVPPQYRNSQSSCGVVLIWTQRWRARRWQ